MDQETFDSIDTGVGDTKAFPDMKYKPVQHHWFYEKNSGDIWKPFSDKDSIALEKAYLTALPNKEEIVPTDGSRFDVNIIKRIKTPVYWKGKSMQVRRCSWFYKEKNSPKYLPYDEEVAVTLENEYKICFETNQWRRRCSLSNGDIISFHSHDVLLLFPPSALNDDWNTTQSQVRPRIVTRGVDEFDIEEGEPEEVDHLLFMVHGIGSVCDLKFRTVQEVVDDFRTISLQLTRSHYQSSVEKKIANRIEVLPISWHDELHSEETEIDKRLKSITLDSIPRLRDFTNDTLLDILFYTSPKYCQNIISTVGNQLNALVELFKERNPSFHGDISLGGHSLGSLILFDLLTHQKNDITSQTNKSDRRISHMYGSVGAGISKIDYPKLNFNTTALFAMGSPIGMFLTIRGLDSLGKDFDLPTCGAFFNIFHPYDPVAYRVESLINPNLSTIKPTLIPHHKGRKRMHLELKETMAKVGADLKQKVLDSVKHTWNTIFQMSAMPANYFEVNTPVEKEVNETKQEIIPNYSVYGKLNKGRRVDYVLQESPFEYAYVSAITSHVCYWESEDTMLFILKEIYSTLNINPDNQIPQATMTIERPLDSSASNSRRNSEISSVPSVSTQKNDNTQNGKT